ncbi:MAG: DUF7344 domain-containing protein [archaeon]
MATNDLDTCLRLIGDWRRRRMLRYMRRNETAVAPVEELIDELAGSQDGRQFDEHALRKRLAVQLAHTHLPVLADEGVVAYDRDDGTVRYQENKRVEAVLDALPEDRPSAGCNWN